MSMAPAGHVIVDCGPYPELGGGGGGGGGATDVPPVAHCFGRPGAGSPNTALVHVVPPVEVTVTENPQVAVWPSLDRAVTVTEVVPSGNEVPEAGFPVTETVPTPP